MTFKTTVLTNGVRHVAQTGDDHNGLDFTWTSLPDGRYLATAMLDGFIVRQETHEDRETIRLWLKAWANVSKDGVKLAVHKAKLSEV